MRVAIANFSPPSETALDFRAYWARYEHPAPEPGVPLMQQSHDWGFHIFAIGSYMLETGVADEVEFWDYRMDRWSGFHPSGILRISFSNNEDLEAYLDRFGEPQLFINYGHIGLPILSRLSRSFRVHIPCAHLTEVQPEAECYLVDREEDVGTRSMLYVPVVQTNAIFPGTGPKLRDFIYLASYCRPKRHDVILNAVRGTQLTGHFHPVNPADMDLQDTKITTSNWYERDIPELLRESRIAVYSGDETSNPAAMWECVAAGLPIVVNENIAGGRHVVVPGVTGEFSSERDFRKTIMRVIERREAYRPREHFEEHWSTINTLNGYLEFFRKMGLKA
jgi:hypothetical protein